MSTKPCLLLTMGDVAGIGPEVIARAWPELVKLSRPVVVGDPHWLRQAFLLARLPVQVKSVTEIGAVDSTPEVAPCIAAGAENLQGVVAGRVSAAAGRAAYDFLCRAIDLTLAGAADGIVTAPLHKEGLKAAGVRHPGHTEILAERTGTGEFAMALYVKGANIPHGLTVIHVTLHMALRNVFAHLSMAAVHEKIRLLDDVTRRLRGEPGRLAVAGLNPHASDGGLFGDEEANIIAPAVAQARREGIDATGPLPSDTLFARARRGEFDGVVAMYHDQGHIALKLLGGMQAVNISVGLPIVRTSVAHGTAYDIAWQGKADPCSMIEATRVAARLTRAGFPLTEDE